MRENANDQVPTSLTDLTQDPAKVALLDRENIPALLAQLGALQSSMAARLLEPASEATETDRRLLTVQQAAQQLGVSADWLYRRTSKLPFVVRLGRHVRYSREGIQKYINRHMGRG